MSVTVIMATYNNERDIGLAVASVLLQDYEEFELVIVNDASTDNTSEILKAFASQDRRIVLLHNDRNLGRPLSRNRAIEVAQGDLIAILDADDIAMPYRLSHQVTYMRDHQDVGMLASWAIRVNENNQPVELIIGPTRDGDIRRQLQWLRMPFVHSTIMIRRNVIMAAGLYDPRFVRSQDFQLCWRFIHEFRGASLPEFLALHRVDTYLRPEFIRAKYKWCAYAVWDCLRRHPTLVGSFNFIRVLLIAFLPGSSSTFFSRMNERIRKAPSEEQKSEVQAWVARLEQFSSNCSQALSK